LRIAIYPLVPEQAGLSARQWLLAMFAGAPKPMGLMVMMAFGSSCPFGMGVVTI
jgi:hypothetical protein